MKRRRMPSVAKIKRDHPFRAADRMQHWIDRSGIAHRHGQFLPFGTSRYIAALSSMFSVIS